MPQTLHPTGPRVLCYLGSAHLREGMCWRDCWDPRSQGGFSQLEDRNPQGKWTSYVKLEMKIKNSNFAKPWKIFTSEIWWQHDGTLNPDSLVACSAVLFTVTMPRVSRAPQIPKHKTRRHRTSTLCHVTPRWRNTAWHKQPINLSINQLQAISTTTQRANSKGQHTPKWTRSRTVHKHRPKEGSQQLEMPMRIRGKPRFRITLFWVTIFGFPARGTWHRSTSPVYSVPKRNNWAKSG